MELLNRINEFLLLKERVTSKSIHAKRRLQNGRDEMGVFDWI